MLQIISPGAPGWKKLVICGNEASGSVGLWSPLAWEEPKREPPRLIVLTQHLPSQLISAGPSTLLLRLLLRLLVRLPQNIFDLVSGQQR